jgi:hypothetical protein
LRLSYQHYKIVLQKNIISNITLKEMKIDYICQVHLIIKSVTASKHPFNFFISFFTKFQERSG